MQIPGGRKQSAIEASGSANRPAVLRWVVSLALLVAAGTVWILPGPKPDAVFGRLNYLEFWTAVVATAGALSVLTVARRPAATRRRAAFKFTAVWLGGALGVLVVELTAFLWPVRHQMDNPWYIAAGGGISASDELPFERPPHLKWRGLSRGDLADGAEDPYARMVTFETDRDGFRNSRDIRQADLIVIGDSYAEAGNLPEEENFTSLAGRRLGMTSRNLGRALYTTPTELIVLKKYGLACRPKVVVWQIAESNDLAESVEYERWVAGGRQSFFDFSRRGRSSRIEAWQRRSTTYRLFSLLAEHQPPVWPFSGIFRERTKGDVFVRFLMEPAMQQPARGNPGWDTFSISLAEGAALCRSNGIRLVVLLVPMKYNALAPYLQMPEGVAEQLARYPGLQDDAALATVLRPFCAGLDVPFVDALAGLRQKAAAGELVYLPYDTHLSPQGHQVIADLLAECIEGGAVSNGAADSRR